MTVEEVSAYLFPDREYYDVQCGNTVLQAFKADMSGYWWLDDDDPAFDEVLWTESLKLFEEGGTGIIALSYDSCHFCNRAIPVLNEVLKETGTRGLYVNVYDMVIQSMSTDIYEDMMDRFYTYTDSILKHEVNEETGLEEPVIYVPLFIAVKDGEIVGYHSGLVDSFTITTGEEQMNDEQVEELKGYYREMIEAIQ